MNNYRTVLLAIDLEPAGQNLLVEKTQLTLKGSNSKLYIIHAVEQISSYGAAYGVAAGAEIEEALLENAQTTMKEIAKRLHLPGDQVIIKIGPPKAVILEEAEKLGAELIIVGSHGRHGIRLLLGSTANAVLHGAKCDVLAVRVKD